jgi:hypothetical protein
MPLIKSTRISPRLCNLPGTSRRADPAMIMRMEMSPTTTHIHDDGFVDRNIEAAEIDRKVVVEFKRMQGTFFHGSFRDASI